MTRIPHFAYPFRFSTSGHALEVEQDTMEDVEACLTALLLTETGQRIELPAFGLDSLLFAVQPLSTDALYDAINENEPRAFTTITSQPDPLDYLTALIEIDVKNNQPQIGGS